MDKQYIVERFALIAGLTMDEASKWADICEESGYEIELKLKSNVDLYNAKRSLTAAAAALAFYKYTMYQNIENNAERFSVGDISVTNSKSSSASQVTNAKRVWNEAYSSISRYLQDDDFSFISI